MRLFGPEVERQMEKSASIGHPPPAAAAMKQNAEDVDIGKPKAHYSPNFAAVAGRNRAGA